MANGYTVSDLVELLCNDDIENALRLDIARAIAIKDRMELECSRSIAEQGEQEQKIERKIGVLHKLLDVKGGQR